MMIGLKSLQSQCQGQQNQLLDNSILKRTRENGQYSGMELDFKEASIGSKAVRRLDILFPTLDLSNV